MRLVRLNRGIVKCTVNKKFLQKKTNDNLYAYLLSKSKYGEVEFNRLGRFIDKSDLTWQECVENVNGINNKYKFYRDMEKLDSLGLITQFEADRMDNTVQTIEIEDVDGMFCFVQKKTIKFMSKNMPPNSIKVYLYLLNKDQIYTDRNGRHYSFTIDEIITECFQNTSTTHPSERRAVSSILNELNKLKLIEWKRSYAKNENYGFYRFRIINTSITLGKLSCKLDSLEGNK